MSASVSPRSRRVNSHREEPLIDFPENPYANDIADLIATLKQTNKHLSELSEAATSTLSFVKRYIPWGIAALAVAYPAMGRLFASLPALPH